MSYRNYFGHIFEKSFFDVWRFKKMTEKMKLNLLVFL